MKVVVNSISLYYQISFNIDGLDIYNDNYYIIEMNECIINMARNFIANNIRNKEANLINKLDPNSSDSTFQINIKDKVFNISFNSNQSINCVLLNSMNGIKLR